MPPAAQFHLAHEAEEALELIGPRKCVAVQGSIERRPPLVKLLGRRRLLGIRN